MTSYLRGWLYGPNPDAASSNVPTIETSTSQEEDDDTDTIHEDDDDSPPAFPALNSAQRATLNTTNTGGLPRILTDAQLMPPPPPPSLASRRRVASASPSSSSLLVPMATTTAPTQSAKRAKVALAPGHGPLDWANLKKSGQNLRGTDELLRVTPSMLKEHRSKDDAWTAINGKVYNMTAYLPYHPGGEKELMRVAGRDGSKLFALTHAWVNVDYMLDECMVGFMTSES
ncbi:cytochrome b5 [Epithele typhae]|uniref:cytochrome b5 n=1 Tax=Epithele typhae TaxID=378194 RepID=UPI002007453A|nr:cytochrome b5 [Epithele typhae]KAH9945117.1 cytochrome b5 [Epithele typhae]